MVIFFAHQAIFQLTPSRRVTLKLSKGGRLTIISTHALTEGDADIFCRFLRQKISTHALTEGDLGQSFHRCCRSCISTHALTEGDKYEEEYGVRFHISTHALTEGDFHFPIQDKSFPIFQLTPSRRATSLCRIMQPGTNFNSRPHGGRPVLLRIIRIRLCISTHALTEGDDSSR